MTSEFMLKVRIKNYKITKIMKRDVNLYNTVY